MQNVFMSLTNQAVSGVKWNGLAMFVKVGVQFVSLAILARLLVPADFGLMSMAVVITGFAQVFSDFGLSNAIIHRQDANREQLSSLYWLNLAVGIALFCMLWLVTPLVVAYYQEPALTAILHWSMASFLIIPLGQQFQSLLRRDLKFKTLSLIQIIENIVYALFAIGLALSNFGVMSLVWATLLRTLIGTGSLIVVAIRLHWLPLFHFRRNDLKGFVRFGLFQMGERFFNYLANNVDYLIIGRFLGSEALGYYTLAYNFMRMPLIYINPVVVSVAFPAFARIQERDDLLRQGYQKILKYLSAITFPLMAGMFVVAPVFVPLVYGAQWSAVIPIIQVFSFLGVIKSLGNPLGSVLLAKGRADLGFYMNILAVVGYAVSNFVGTHWGIVGVAVSSLAFTLLILFPVDFYLRWLTIRMPVREFCSAVRSPLLAMLPTLFLAGGLYLSLAPAMDIILKLSLLVLTGAMVYSIFLWRLDRGFVIEAWMHLKLDSKGKINQTDRG